MVILYIIIHICTYMNLLIIKYLVYVYYSRLTDDRVQEKAHNNHRIIVVINI